ncbi:uncharacterized protein F54H12.2-like [Folsomia candida]|uniref:uncharacterized protein F54H12.2-like n=1 Tax=Folsomia candida TaxID=158441 RepID=UPI000B8F7AD3|nr:uncharacterized protein F54H12.2-like [Folsomia candida]XP_021963632.1 uncharacterized protein F54H12.2-like [Folsomia candida]
MAKPKQIVNFIRSETDLFSEPGYDLTLASSHRVDYHPITNISDRSTPLTFIIQGNDSQYIDFSETQLYIRCKIVDSKGADRDAAQTDTAPVNNFLHSMFSQVAIYFNDTQITSPTSLYPYKAYLETLLSFGKEYTKTQAMAALYHKEADPTTGDEGWKTREKLANNSKVFELCGKLKTDIFNQNRFCIPGIDIKIVLYRAPDSFCLLSKTSGSAQDAAQLHIMEAKFVVQKHTLLPSITMGHLRLMEKGQPACYPMRRGDMKSFSLSAGTLQYTNESLITGLLPDRLVVGIVSSKAVHGHYNENPFNFLQADISSITVTVNSEQVTSQTFELDFDNKKSIEAYFSVFSGLGLSNLDTGIELTFDIFKTGKTLYVFDLRHQHDGFAIPRHGSVKIEIKLRNATTSALTVLCHCDYQSVLYVDKNRHIYFKDYSM